MHVIVIGGGWSGLATATELVAGGASVTVLESARQLGGRARAVPFKPHHVDNGQHILIGAYTETLAILERIGIDPATVFKRVPLQLPLIDLRHHKRRRGTLRGGRLPAPLHLLTGLLGFPLTGPRGKWRILRMLSAMQKARFQCQPDVTLGDYFRSMHQSESAIRTLWEPLCLATLNTPVDDASTQLFMNVLRDAFFGAREYSDLLLPTVHLGRCFPEPAVDYIEQRSGLLKLATRVSSLAMAGHRTSGVITRQGTLPADHVVVATGPSAAHQLLSGHEALRPLASQISRLNAMPITTLYLQYPKDVKMERDFSGLVGTTTQWVFDRGRLTGENGLMSAIVSGPGEHMQWDAQALTDHMVSEIARAFPAWPVPQETWLIREKRATFAATRGVQSLRPGHTTPVNGLWLAGDYTDTGYPSTLEGAVRSGTRTAKAILATNNQ